jgi:formylglycine-generating enzyme required for sulfatase activity
MRSHDELLAASGYTGRPMGFEELLGILDGELRLVTPTDPEGVEPESSQPPATARGHYYQLTHDYLVPSLRDWLTRKQKETRRGRAELRLAERAALWNGKPENRYLPTWWEWLNTRLLTRQYNWTPSQRTMMRRAARYHGVRGAALALLLLAMTLLGLDIRGRVVAHSNAQRAAGLVQRLLDADIAGVPSIIQEMEGYRRWADPILKQRNAEAPAGSRQKLFTGLALLPVDEGQVEHLSPQLLQAGPVDLPVIQAALRGHRDALVGRLWDVLEDRQAESGPRFCAACALAGYDVTGDDANRERWRGVSPFVADQLLAAVQRNPSHYDPLLKTLGPVRDRLVGPLSAVFRSKERPSEDHTWATSILAEYAADRPDKLADLVQDADERQFVVLFPKLEAHRERAVAVMTETVGLVLDSKKSEEEKESLAKRQANAGVALLRLGQADTVWPILRHSPDPRVRSYLIHRLSTLGADPKAIIGRLDEEPDLSIRRALLMALGEFGEKQVPPDEREVLLPKLFDLYRDDADPGLHGAAEWLLRQWKQDPWLKRMAEEWAADKGQRGRRLERIGQELAKEKGAARPQWYVNGQGQTLVIIPGPVEFLMGSPSTESSRGEGETWHRHRIGRSFAIAAAGVTVEQFRRFDQEFGHNQMVRSPDPDCPILGVTWYEAAKYCNWLSKAEGLPEQEWCYLPNPQGQFAEGMRLAPDYLKRTGYRLPTEAEFEYTCRAGAATSRYYGDSDELLVKYAWYSGNAKERTWPVRSLKPNDLGLFDMHGNLFGWCQERTLSYEGGEGRKLIADTEDAPRVLDKEARAYRGSSFFFQGTMVRSAHRDGGPPTTRDCVIGFRPARTFP